MLTTTFPNNGLNTAYDFFAFNPAQQGGVRLAFGDINGVGREFLIAAPGPGGPSVVNVFDSKQISGGAGGGNSGGPSGPTVPYDIKFSAGNPNYTGGLYVAAGDLTGNGIDSIIVGSGSGTATVSIFNNVGGLVTTYNVPSTQAATQQGGPTGPGTTINTPNGILLNSSIPSTLVNIGGILGGGGSLFGNQGGARVAAVDWTGDGVENILVANGPGNAPIFQVFNPNNLQEITSTQVFASSFIGGLNLGAGNGV